MDGGTSGSAVDGYVEGAVVYADNDQDITPLVEAGTVFTSPEFITTYTLNAEEHGVDGEYGVTGSDADGWVAYLVSGDDISETADTDFTVTSSDQLPSAEQTGLFWRGTEESYYALTTADHGVSEDANYILREV